MTDRLHRMLDPDERIRHETSGRDLPAFWRSKLADWIGLSLFGPGILIPFSDASADELAGLYLMAGGMISVAFPIWLLARSVALKLRPDRLIVTDRRLLYRAGGFLGTTALSIAFKDIVRIEGMGALGSNAVRLHGGGHRVMIPAMTDPKPIAAVLRKARQANRIDIRSWPAKFEIEKTGFLAAWSAIMMGGSAALKALGLVDMQTAPDSGLVILIPLVILGIVGAAAVGPSLAYLVSLAIARPFTPWKRMRQIVETSEWLPSWNRTLVRRWVGLLYGRPLDSRPG